MQQNNETTHIYGMICPTWIRERFPYNLLHICQKLLTSISYHGFVLQVYATTRTLSSGHVPARGAVSGEHSEANCTKSRETVFTEGRQRRISLSPPFTDIRRVTSLTVLGVTVTDYLM